jgi:hypothetical protein
MRSTYFRVAIFEKTRTLSVAPLPPGGYTISLTSKALVRPSFQLRLQKFITEKPESTPFSRDRALAILLSTFWLFDPFRSPSLSASGPGSTSTSSTKRVRVVRKPLSHICRICRSAFARISVAASLGSRICSTREACRRRPGDLISTSCDGSFKGVRLLAGYAPPSRAGRGGHSGSMTLPLLEVWGNTVIVDDPKDSSVREGCLSVTRRRSAFSRGCSGFQQRLQRVAINACCNKYVISFFHACSLLGCGARARQRGRSHASRGGVHHHPLPMRSLGLLARRPLGPPGRMLSRGSR